MTKRTPAQYDWDKALFNDRRLTKHFTSPRRSKITHVTLHHMTIVSTGTDASNSAALEGCYKTWQTREASANYGVAGNQVWQFVSDNDAPWSDASSTSNHSTLSIEHANSTAGPGWKIANKTMETGQRLVATLHRLYGLGRPSRKTVKVHRDFYATSCPGPYMMAHLDAYIAAAAKFYDGDKPAPTPTPKPEPKPKTQKATVLVLNAASRNKDVTKKYGAWSKRVGKAAAFIKARGADFTVVDELYVEHRPALMKLLPDHECDAVRGGRVIIRRKASNITPIGGSFWTDLLPGTGTKYAVARKYLFQSGARFNLANAHFSFETNAAGSSRRKQEAAGFIKWVRGKFPTDYDGYFGDVNAPYKATTRADDVGPVFEKNGLHDFGDDVKAKPGVGHYHLLRGFGGLVKATALTVHDTDFTDHEGVVFTLAIPIK